MRKLITLSLLVLLCSLQLTSAVGIQGPNSSPCCSKFSTIRIPLKRVVSYTWTSSNCPKKAIVFETIGGNRICVDPEASWVSGHVATVDKRKSAASPTNTAPTNTTKANTTMLSTTTLTKA
ncbi:monocyte chemotactic protein 1B-like [Chanos chanos]|uniref:Monocyte chemotactic protein 1B-like n=1 Tax=Chanos chanos TaxID=29144 RepID=A0A6J2WBK9_CHACN|nr:monocyte chemotactic protein 1B-like [Chanos chanos]